MHQQDFGFEQLIEWQITTKEDAEKITNLVQTGKSVIVAGNFGSGLATLLNIVAEQVKEKWRIVTIEKKPEISFLKRKRATQLVTPNNKNDELPALVELASELRGDYNILNEITGPELMPYIELLRNNSSGIASITADNVFDAIKKIEYKAVAILIFGEELRTFVMSSARLLTPLSFKRKKKMAREQFLKLQSLNTMTEKFD